MDSERKRILGIDEAGRGSVIGPMVICAVLVNEKQEMALRNIGVKDSKKISAQERERLAKEIREIVEDFDLLEISPQAIDGESLNRIEFLKIQEMHRKYAPTHLYIDAPTSPRGVKNFLRDLCYDIGASGPEIIAENKADGKYPVVSAASILAKVERDRIVENLRKVYGDFGSGYPSDAKTVKFLKAKLHKMEDWGKIVRQRWKTVSRIRPEVKQYEFPPAED
jgi:ribonuclease HII